MQAARCKTRSAQVAHDEARRGALAKPFTFTATLTWWLQPQSPCAALPQSPACVSDVFWRRRLFSRARGIPRQGVAALGGTCSHQNCTLPPAVGSLQAPTCIPGCPPPASPTGSGPGRHINLLPQSTRSICSLNPLDQSTSSTHSINPLHQPPPSTHPINLLH
ncbi:hypothetical protein PMIN01_03204 [Paraphaeosphaeria minitans]|uniref:Uncharacterized protein n=1 Tax=Paraphaeosphaeria minitans TaxID=565426 RepID=A0A9P6KTG3_9PLEO|nr:hypothetical protein PMIN01_03204 [Paraphaeosphaeria minitans]